MLPDNTDYWKGKQGNERNSDRQPGVTLDKVSMGGVLEDMTYSNDETISGTQRSGEE